MSGAVRLEEQLQCSICLEVFTEPVSTPCGHNFCKSCLTQHWAVSRCCFCPMCKKIFTIKPELKKNTLISEMASLFKKGIEVHSKKPEVPCDFCSDPKLKAVKSCLVCLCSYCEPHLQPHLTVSGLRRHQLLDPVKNLEDRMCPTHDKPLELFCRTDQSCVCMMCTFSDHKGHEAVPLKDECDQRKSSLQQTQTESQHMVEQRRKKIQEIQRSVELSQRVADSETAAGFQIFTALMESVQRSQAQFLEKVKEKQRQTQKQAQDLVQELKEEICELEKRSSMVEQLSRCEDHLLFLQRFTELRPAAALKDWSTVSFEPETCEGRAARALFEIETTLTAEMNKLASRLELYRVQQSAVNITLDPNTAHPSLVLSEDLKQVYDSDVNKELPDTPQRFSVYPNALGKQCFALGRFYFEVQVKGKTDWDLGVAQESINRKGSIRLSPENGIWTIILRNRDKYKACADPPVPLSLKCPPQKVGVFVDHSQGLISFHDVDSADLIFSFTGCSFRDKLFPYFSPCLNKGGTNSAPLILTDVKNRDQDQDEDQDEDEDEDQNQDQDKELVQKLEQEICEPKTPLNAYKESELKRVQQSAVNITLDPQTANPWLVLSEDLKQVHYGDVKKELPDIPQRFTKLINVLGKQCFSSGKFYFEVQVKGKTEWTLGVTQESINRKGMIALSPTKGIWSICLRNSDEYKACAGPNVWLSLKCPPQKVGVFVDHSQGLISFYDVDSADLIFSFTGCCFSEKLFPFFSPGFNNRGTNSAPLILTEV